MKGKATFQNWYYFLIFLIFLIFVCKNVLWTSLWHFPIFCIKNCVLTETFLEGLVWPPPLPPPPFFSVKLFAKQIFPFLSKLYYGIPSSWTNVFCIMKLSFCATFCFRRQMDIPWYIYILYFFIHIFYHHLHVVKFVWLLRLSNNFSEQMWNLTF